jgi:hypothetical protein
MTGLRPASIGLLFAAGLLVTATNRAVFGPHFDNFMLELFVLAAVAIAATSFESGDPPRGAWILLTVAMGCLNTAHVLTPFTPNAGTISVRHVFTFAHNVMWVAAFWRLHSVFRHGGISRPWTESWRVFFPCVVACALAIGTWGVLRHAEPLFVRASDLTVYDFSLATVNASSGIANGFVLVIGVDLARILLPLRGGTLAQPYVLLAFGATALLAIDLVTSVTQTATFLALGPVVQYVLAIGWTSVIVAALSQASIVRSATRRLPD